MYKFLLVYDVIALDFCNFQSSEVPHFDWLPALFVAMEQPRQEFGDGFAHRFLKGLTLECVDKRVHNAVEEKEHVYHSEGELAQKGGHQVEVLFIVNCPDMTLYLLTGNICSPSVLLN